MAQQNNILYYDSITNKHAAFDGYTITNDHLVIR